MLKITFSAHKISFPCSSGPVFVISPKHNQPLRASGAAARYLVQNSLFHLRNNRRLWHCGSAEPLLQPALAPAWFVREIEEQTENKKKRENFWKNFRKSLTGKRRAGCGQQKLCRQCRQLPIRAQDTADWHWHKHKAVTSESLCIVGHIQPLQSRPFLPV